MPIAEVIAGLGGLKTALDILKGAKDLKGAPVAIDIQSLQAAIIEAQRGLIAANEVHAADVEEIRSLKESMRKEEERQTELARYELRDLGWGAFAYMLKKDTRGSEPPHWVCTNCFKKGKVSILQMMWPKSGKGPHRPTCPDCLTSIEPSLPAAAWSE